MAYLNPLYNGRSGLYPGNKIERFGTVPQNEFAAGDTICIKFVPTSTVKFGTVFNINGATWTGTTYFFDAVVAFNSFIRESYTSPILVNPTIVNLNAGNSLLTVSSVSTTPTIGVTYWLTFKVAPGCTISLGAGSNITYSSTDTYIETPKANSNISIVY